MIVVISDRLMSSVTVEKLERLETLTGCLIVSATPLPTISTLDFSCFDDIPTPTHKECIIPSIEEYKKIFQHRHLIVESGKINKLWDDYHGIWIIWEPPVKSKPSSVIRSKFIRRFRGNNRGRHWNRKINK